MNYRKSLVTLNTVMNAGNVEIYGKNACIVSVWRRVCYHTSVWSNQSQWPRGRKRVSAAVCLQGLRVRICPGTWISVSCECCVLSGRGLCDGPNSHAEECILVCHWVWPSGTITSTPTMCRYKEVKTKKERKKERSVWAIYLHILCNLN